jgi:hypothetical protein
VLSVDQQTGLANDGRPAQTAEEQKARRDQQMMGGTVTRTVGLAVPQALASRLLLAAQAGTLRLAVRSADEQLLARYWSGQDASAQVDAANRELYRFSQLSQVPLAGPAAVAAVPTMQIIRGAAQAADTNKTLTQQGCISCVVLCVVPGVIAASLRAAALVVSGPVVVDAGGASGGKGCAAFDQLPSVIEMDQGLQQECACR